MQEQQHFCTLYLATTLESEMAPARDSCRSSPGGHGEGWVGGTRTAAAG